MAAASAFVIGLRRRAVFGLKARHVIARAEGPGIRRPTRVSALKGRDIRGTDCVSALQASRNPGAWVPWACARRTRFSPGYHMAGLRPYRKGLLVVREFGILVCARAVRSSPSCLVLAYDVPRGFQEGAEGLGGAGGHAVTGDRGLTGSRAVLERTPGARLVIEQLSRP